MMAPGLAALKTGQHQRSRHKVEPAREQTEYLKMVPVRSVYSVVILSLEIAADLCQLAVLFTVLSSKLVLFELTLSKGTTFLNLNRTSFRFAESSNCSTVITYYAIFTANEKKVWMNLSQPFAITAGRPDSNSSSISSTGSGESDARKSM